MNCDEFYAKYLVFDKNVHLFKKDRDRYALVCEDCVKSMGDIKKTSKRKPNTDIDLGQCRSARGII